MITKVEVEVNELGYQLTSGIVSFLKKVKEEVDDNGGWDFADDIPGVVSASVTELLPAIKNVMNVGDELEKDQILFYKGVALGLSELAEIFVKKEKQAQEPATTT